MRCFAILLIVLCYHTAKAQPYLDIVNFRYQHSPDAGLTNKDNRSNRFDYYNASLNVPLIFKRDSSMIVFSPFADIWRIHAEAIPDIPDLFQSVALPVSFIKPLDARWSLTITAIPRWNGYEARWFNDDFQMGGALLATYKKSNALRYKFGIYYNSEFSGAFVMPLFGIDWQINEKNNLFGVLPGHLVFEHKVTKRFYWGASFRSITNSYKSDFLNFSLIPTYIRIQESQLAFFTDIYLTKSIVLGLEAGHSVARKFRLGIKDAKPRYYFDESMNSNLLLKASVAYRLRLR